MTATNDDSSSKPSNEARLIVAVIVSAVWVTLIIGLACYLQPSPGAADLTLNEWGDFIAGAFAPLAFFWLVVGYFQQGEELGQNTQALRLQAQELKAAVEQYKHLVDVSRAEFDHVRSEDQKRWSEEYRRAQPRIVVRQSTITANRIGADGKFRIDMSRSTALCNEGRSVPVTRVDLEPGSPARLSYQPVFWETGLLFNFHLTMIEENHRAGGLLRCRLWYTDGNNNPQWVDLTIQNPEAGTHTITIGPWGFEAPAAQAVEQAPVGQ